MINSAVAKRGAGFFDVSFGLGFGGFFGFIF